MSFARGLAAHHVELVSTGGTAKALHEAGLSVRDIDDLTGFPEMLDGRVKTLHPKVHGGILHMRSKPEHLQAVAEHGIEPIDMVVVNLYAFEKTAARAGVAFGGLIENIDIGGPSMLRSAAKNFEDVAVVTDPVDYEALIAELAANAGALSRATRWRLMRAAFATTAAYDVAIANALDRVPGEEPPAAEAPAISQEQPAHTQLPHTIRLVLPPRRQPALRREPAPEGPRSTPTAANAALREHCSSRARSSLTTIWSTSTPAGSWPRSLRRSTSCTAPTRLRWWPSSNTPIPAGRLPARRFAEAFQKALAADPVSAFGGVIGVNTEIDEAAAERRSRSFSSRRLWRPATRPAPENASPRKKNLRLLEIEHSAGAQVLRQISGGLLLQDAESGDCFQRRHAGGVRA